MHVAGRDSVVVAPVNGLGMSDAAVVQLAELVASIPRVLWVEVTWSRGTFCTHLRCLAD